MVFVLKTRFEKQLPDVLLNEREPLANLVFLIAFSHSGQSAICPHTHFLIVQLCVILAVDDDVTT